MGGEDADPWAEWRADRQKWRDTNSRRDHLTIYWCLAARREQLVEEHIGSNEERYVEQTPVRTPHATEGPSRVLLGADSAALPQIRFPPLMY